jgi:hypothetical protein
LYVHGLHWGAAALHEDEATAFKKEKIVKAFAADPIAFLSGKVTYYPFFSILSQFLFTGNKHRQWRCGVIEVPTYQIERIVF